SLGRIFDKEQGLLRTREFDFQSNSDGKVQAASRGFPNAWFRVSELKQAGMHDQLITTLREHGVKRK
ncbi:MAG: hypothetical protein AAF299_04840, partial [Pseudomonadota bacterium]